MLLALGVVRGGSVTRQPPGRGPEGPRYSKVMGKRKGSPVIHSTSTCEQLLWATACVRPWSQSQTQTFRQCAQAEQSGGRGENGRDAGLGAPGGSGRSSCSGVTRWPYLHSTAPTNGGREAQMAPALPRTWTTAWEEGSDLLTEATGSGQSAAFQVQITGQ